MTKGGRFGNILVGFLMVAVAVIILMVMSRSQQLALLIIILFLAASQIVEGLRYLVFYGTMARHMVGGKTILSRGIITLDIGAFIFASFNGTENVIILLYILVFRLVNGAIDVLRMLEAKKSGAPWKLHLISAIINLGCVVAGTIFLQNPNAVIIIYCITLVYSAISRFIAACQKTAIVYIA